MPVETAISRQSEGEIESRSMKAQTIRIAEETQGVRAVNADNLLNSAG